MKTKGLIIGLLLLIAGFGLLLFQFENNDYYKSQFGLKLVVFDVGQGDSIYFSDMKGTDFVIDGGPNSDVLEKIDREMGYLDRRIEHVFLTHPHSDHIDGLIHIFQDYNVENLYIPSVDYGFEVEKLDKLVSISENKGVVIHDVWSGIELGMNDYVLKILNPEKGMVLSDRSELNNTSIVIKLSYNDCDWMFTGDAEIEAEQKMINMYREKLESDVLKVGHHGSKTSSSKEFINYIKPSYGIISAGIKNDYGHPHKEVLGRLSSNNIEIIETSEYGDVKMYSDGFKIYQNNE